MKRLGIDTDNIDNLIDVSPQLDIESPNTQNMGGGGIDSSQNISISQKNRIRIENWTTILQYAELSGDKLRLYNEEPKRHVYNHMQGSHQFVIYRKSGLVEFRDDLQTFVLLLQDSTAKFKQKKLKFECLLKNEYLTWIDCLKKTQRPQWADPEVNSCYICESEFSLINRQHHCRKCGTAVCKSCSNFFVVLPEYAYKNRVRTCRNCIEVIQERERNLRRREKYLLKQNLISGGDGQFIQQKNVYQTMGTEEQNLIIENMGSRSDRPQDRMINQFTPGDNSLAQIDQIDLRYQRDHQGYNSFNNHISNNPDESNSYLHLSQFPA